MKTIRSFAAALLASSMCATAGAAEPALAVPADAPPLMLASDYGVEIIRGDGHTPAVPSGHRGREEAKAANRDVVMYSATWCGYCAKAREYFDQHHIAYSEYDVEHSSKGREDYQAFGRGGLPLILVGESGMHGFSAASFSKMYYGR